MTSPNASVHSLAPLHREESVTAKAAEVIHQLEPKVVVPMSYDPDAKKDAHAPFDRLLHELGVKELTPVAKLSVTRGSLPENVQVVALDSRAR